MTFFKISKFFLYAALFSIVLVSTQTLFPFIVIKYVFFRATVAFAFIAFLLGWFSIASREEGRRFERDLLSCLKSPLVIAVSVFVIIFLLAGFFGLNSSYSFWSNFERGEGGFQMLHFYVFFLLLVTLFRDKKEWRTAFGVSLVSAVLMIVYGVLGGLGVTGFVGVPLKVGNRFQGSLGNTAYVGTYLLFSLFYVFYLLNIKSSKKRKVLLWSLVPVFLIFLWLTQTRGPFLGLGFGLLVFLLFLIFRSAGAYRRVGVFLFIIVIVFGGVLFQIRDTPIMKKLAFSRFFNITFSNLSTQSRFWSWQSALKGWQERPLLGWGPENFSRVFDKYFDTRHFVPGVPSDTWYDRAHSVFFDYLTETGILGLLSYLGIFVVFYIEFFRHGSRFGIPLVAAALVFSMPVAYLVQGLVIFDVLPIYLNLFLFLAFANFLFMGGDRRLV